MIIDVRTLEDLSQRLGALLPASVGEAREDLTRNFRSALQAGLTRLDLVTREEFEVQRLVLRRTREKLEALEKRLTEMETAG
jgi:ubiquinone biosynthesis accessory factor UbiK